MLQNRSTHVTLGILGFGLSLIPMNEFIMYGYFVMVAVCYLSLYYLRHSIELHPILKKSLTYLTTEERIVKELEGSRAGGMLGNLCSIGDC